MKIENNLMIRHAESYTMSIFPVILSVWITHESTCLVSSLPSWLLEVIIETSNGPMAVFPLIVITVTVIVLLLLLLLFGWQFSRYNADRRIVRCKYKNKDIIQRHHLILED